MGLIGKHFLGKEIMYYIPKLLWGNLKTRTFFNEQSYRILVTGKRGDYGNCGPPTWKMFLYQDTIGRYTGWMMHLVEQILVKIFYFFEVRSSMLKIMRRAVLCIYGLAL